MVSWLARSLVVYSLGKQKGFVFGGHEGTERLADKGLRLAIERFDR
jgi:hypothetical protein